MKTLTPNEAANLPIGSLVLVDGDWFIVVTDGLIPITILPKCSNSIIPKGEHPNLWGNVKLELVKEGDGKIPTHNTIIKNIDSGKYGRK